MTDRDLSPQDDDALMAQVRDRNCVGSFAELFERWQGRIHRSCFRMTGDWQSAEDLTQETFVRVFRARHRFDGRAKFGTWTWTIAMNATRDLMRKRKTQASVQPGSEVIESAAADQGVESTTDQIDRVQAALLRLPAHYREVVVLRHYEQLKFHEIAGLLGVPRGTVASRMAKALQLLRNILGTGPAIPGRPVDGDGLRRPAGATQ